MQNVVLTIHLILALLLTGAVLMQRSEGGGLGVGGGSGGGVMSGRQAANAMTRLTWIFGIALFITSITLTIIAARETSNSSIMDQIGASGSSQQQDSETPGLPSYTPPPMTEGDPLTPPAPVTTPEAQTVPESSADEPVSEPITPPAATDGTETAPSENEAAPAAESEVQPETGADPAPSQNNSQTSN